MHRTAVRNCIDRFLSIIEMRGHTGNTLKFFTSPCLLFAPTLPFPVKPRSSGPVWNSGPALVDTPTTCSSDSPDRVVQGSQPSQINMSQNLFTRGLRTHLHDQPKLQCQGMTPK